MRPDVTLPGWLSDSLDTDRLGTLASVLRRGSEHRNRLTAVDNCIVVSGTRGKSSMTRQLHDVLSMRGHDTMAKVTGNHPVSLRNGREQPIERGERVTLYENEREIRRHTPSDTLVLENQAITDYTTRVFNGTFADPDVVAFTNVRRDHLDTLGSDRIEIARSLCRSVPAGTHVVNGEQDAALRQYIEAELDRRDATVTHVDVPDAHAGIPGAEVVYATDAVLEAIGEQPLSRSLRHELLDDFRVEWDVLSDGSRVFNAASVNDIESTEMLRQALQADDERIEPFVHLRPDRRARTISFIEYLAELADDDVFEHVHVAGGHAGLFQRKAPFPVVVHDKDDRSPSAVLDDLLASGRSVFIMGNTVATFMRELNAEIDRRIDAAADPADTERHRRQPAQDD